MQRQRRGAVVAAVQSGEGGGLLQGLVGRDDGAALRMKILLRLRSEPVTAALAGVVPLLGGVIEKC